MAEYIDRQAVIDLVDKGYLVSNSNYGSVSRIVRQIPAADVQPVKRGRWMEEHLSNTNGGTYAVVRCSECKSQFPIYKTHFCPNCGARMDGEA